MVYRIYVEKRPGLSPEAGNLLSDLRDFLGVKSLEGLRILNRYDVEHIDPAVYARAKGVVFSEPQVDLTWDETFPEPRTYHSLLAVEALPGQFDQRADSCAQCVQLMSGAERPLVAYAKVYLLEGRLSGGSWRRSSTTSSTRWRAGRPPWTSRTPWSAATPSPPWWRP